jgi:hypothetical protein
MNRRRESRKATHGHLRRVFHVSPSHTGHSSPPVSDRRHERARQAFKIAHKVALAARLGALREAPILLDGLPLLRDEIERPIAVLDHSRLDEPAPDDDARAADPATAVHGRDTSAPRVVPEDVEDLAYIRFGAWETSVGDREGVVLDVAWLDAADTRDVRCEVWCVWGELAALRQIDKRTHAGTEQQIELL